MDSFQEDISYCRHVLHERGVEKFIGFVDENQVSKAMERLILLGYIEKLTSQRNSYCFWMTVFLFAAVVFLFLGALT